MKKVHQFGVICILISLLFYGCSKVQANIDNTQKSIFDETLLNIFNSPFSITSQMSYVTTKDEIKRQYGKPDITREHYEIRNLSDGSKLFVIYDSNVVIDIWRLKSLLNRNDFEQIQINKDTDVNIRKIDLYFRLLEIEPNKAISEHRLKDNGVATVEYTKENSAWVVKTIKYIDKDPSGFISKLVPEDLKPLLK